MSFDTTATTRPAPSLAELQRSEFSRFFGSTIRLRLVMVPPVFAAAVALAAVEATPWRWGLLVGLPLALSAVSLVEVRRFERLGMARFAIELNLALAVAGQLVASGATGGLESPLMPLVLIVGFAWALMVPGGPWYDGAVLALQLASPWAFAAIALFGLVPDFNLRIFGGGPRGGHGALHLLTSAALLNVGTLVTRLIARRLRAAFDGGVRRAVEANEALRREHLERSQALVTLTSEIAHELKNPLATVKGLASLLAHTASAGKDAERLGVLRQEVDRMRATLDDFLNLSRPLLPLALASAELAEVCREVVALHEGMALSRGVSMRVEGQARASCDARKVRQLLINLVQNALEASPPGGVLELQCGLDGTDKAVVRVLDRGPGLPASLRPRLFEPGVTSKPQGNGLGLTLSRALARQHGGDLVVEDRAGGGCDARVWLPVSPARELQP